jgi:hypothetical protein
MIRLALSLNVAVAAVFNAVRLAFDSLAYGVLPTTTYALYASVMLLTGSLSLLTLGATNGLNYVLPIISTLGGQTTAARATTAAAVLCLFGSLAVMTCVLIVERAEVKTPLTVVLVAALVLGYYFANLAIALLRNTSDRLVNLLQGVLCLGFMCSYGLIASSMVSGEVGLLMLCLIQIIVAIAFIASPACAGARSAQKALAEDVWVIARYGIGLAVAGQLFFLMSSVDRLLVRMMMDTSVFARLSFLSSLASIVLGVASIILSVNQPKLLRQIRSLAAPESARLGARLALFIALVGAVVAALISVALIWPFWPLAEKYHLQGLEAARVACGIVLAMILVQSSYLQYVERWRYSMMFLLAGTGWTALCCVAYLQGPRPTATGLSAVYLTALAVCAAVGQIIVRQVAGRSRA